jgi:ornithine--oxo-acid transaminase
MQEFIDLEKQYSPDLFKTAPVVISRGEGAEVYDYAGRAYLDMMNAVSSANFGHCHPRLVQALTAQANKIGMISRLYYSAILGKFLQKACEMSGMKKAIPLNSGTEAIEAALKAARKWGYLRKAIPKDQAEIICCQGNFHGRSITIISASTVKPYQEHFGPLTAGFKTIPYDDPAALLSAITPNTAAFIVEPIQGEAGVMTPSPGYLKKCQAICHQKNVLLICDEIQTGMGRTGKFLASQYDNIIPSAVLLGKSLGGGLLPVSLFLGNEELMSVFSPGDHGSTFGGNPLASAVAYEALQLLDEENLCENAQKMGHYFLSKLANINNPILKSVRGWGLLIGMEINPDRISSAEVSTQLIKAGLLNVNSRNNVIRLLPPLNISKDKIDYGVSIIKNVLNEIQSKLE